jgi:membrane associated rhomboid family serine protease
MGPVLALIVINLVLGFTGNVEWQAHIGGLIVGSALALGFNYASTLGKTFNEVALSVGASALTLGVLAVLVLSIAPGHVNVS